MVERSPNPAGTIWAVPHISRKPATAEHGVFDILIRQLNALQRKALIIEDNQDIARLISLHLADIDIHGDIALDGEQGLELFRSRDYHLVILDLMLPGRDGLKICREIRTLSEHIPVLMVTAKTAEIDRIAGLETGADDYITKPFSLAEMLARVRALLRRADLPQSKENPPQHHLEFRHGELYVNSEKRAVHIGARSIELTAREFDLLLFFMRNPGRVYTREELLSEVWGYGHGGYQHTVNSHINRLRSKIENDPTHPSYILTVWGVGYKFADTGH